MTQPPRSRPSVVDIAGYFLRLGALGFGGPVALANHMRVDLVDRRRWLSPQEYDEGLAIATACPGPLAYQLGIYCGYVLQGFAGAIAAAVAFATAPFAIVVVAGWFYVRYENAWELRGLFYGVGPVVVALIVKACWNLAQKTIKTDALAWAIAGTACAITLVVQRELTIIFIAAGLLGIFLFARPPTGAAPGAERRPAKSIVSRALFPVFGAVALGSGSALPLQIFWFFFRTGLLVFGSGIVIVPFLKAYVVDQYHWLDQRQFLDSVAMGMMTPGPVVITATFVGYLMSGISGAAAATIGIFSPSFLFTVAGTPLLRKYRANARLQGFVRGVTVAVVGVLVGTSYLVGKTVIGDALTVALALIALGLVLFVKRLPDPLLVAGGAIAGLIAYPLLQPQWLLR